MDVMALLIATLKFVVNYIFTQFSSQTIDWLLGLF